MKAQRIMTEKSLKQFALFLLAIIAGAFSMTLSYWHSDRALSNNSSGAVAMSTNGTQCAPAMQSQSSKDKMLFVGCGGFF